MAVLSITQLNVTAWGTSLLEGINLEVEAGNILSIIGPNGAGKTTLLNTIRNSIQPTSGQVLLSGVKINQWANAELAKHFAVLPQQSLLNFPFAVEEVVSLGRIPHSSGNLVDGKIVEEVANLLDITHLFGRSYTRLSGGEKQRVQLARVMAQIWRAEDSGERLLLLDEPTNALDLGHQRQLMQLIRKFAQQGVAVVMVMHDIDLAASYSDEILALSCGRSIAQGKAEDVVVPDVLKTLYGVEIDVLQHPKTGRPVLLKS